MTNCLGRCRPRTLVWVFVGMLLTAADLPGQVPTDYTAARNDLDSDAFAVRERASTELADAIESAASALRRTLKSDPSLETHRRIE